MSCADPNAPPTHEPQASTTETPASLTSVLRVADGLRRVFGSPGYKPPMLPSAALEIHELSCHPDVETDKLIALLEREPLLAGHVLKVANSPIFRGRDAETSLRNAVLRLGLKNLGEVVFELALHMRVFRSAEYSDLMEDLRRHSTACGNLCRMLATRAGQDPENAFLCGLLHDIGIAAILIVLGERRKSEPALEGALLEEVVRQTHEDVSGMLVRLWKLSDEVAEVVTHHHGRPTLETAPVLSCVVVVADTLCKKFGFSVDFGSGVADGSDGDAMALARDRLKLDAGAMAEVEREARDVLERVEQSLAHNRAEPGERSEHGLPDPKAAVPPVARPKAPAVSSARKSPMGFLARIASLLWRRRGKR